MRINFNHINRFIMLVLLSLTVLQYASAQNQSAQRQSAAQIAMKVDEYMNAARRVNGFSGSVLVARDGQPVISKGYGMANMELNVPNSPQTVFRIGSLTKQFTALAIMMLQERNKLNVQDSICKYLSDCPSHWQPITIRNLLTHSSGISDYATPDVMKKAALPISPIEVTAIFKDKPLEFTPGEKIAYSNSGYYLLGLIIERASGKSYADFLQENIFKTLGLKQTGYDDARRVMKNRASGYRLRGSELSNAPYVDMTLPYSTGALYSTTEDMLVWEQSFYTEKLVSRKSLDEIFTPFKDLAGYGWGIRNAFNRQSNSHSGGIFGFSSYIVRFPEDKVTVIVLGNNQSAPASKIANDLAAIVFGEPYNIPQERKEIAFEPKTLEKYIGQYQVDPTSIIIVTLENGKLMGQLAGQAKNELFAESETKFFLKAVNAQITFVKDAEGRVTNLILHQGGRNVPAQKIK